MQGGKYTTAWSGQYYQESSGKDGEVLLTTWIMTANVPDIKEYWEATSIGQDRFTRTPQKPKGRKSLIKKWTESPWSDTDPLLEAVSYKYG